jgi:predicted glutamine amidotransferase
VYTLSLKHYQTKTWQREIAMASNGSIARYRHDNKHQTRSMRGTYSSITNTNTLKIDKALKKKLDATKRHQNALYEYTRGGLVITADAATFELFKIVATIYYENLPESLGKAYITQSTDSTQRHNV